MAAANRHAAMAITPATNSTLDPRGASRAIAFTLRSLEQRYEVAAANLSNLETAGHKRLVARSPGYSAGSFAAEVARARSADLPTLVRDFSQGDVLPNDDPSELALQGDGFFAVEAGGEIRYARALRVQVDPDGTLIDGQGGRISGESGPIRLTGPLSKLQIERDGAVKSDGVEVGRLRVVAFVDPQALTAMPGGRFVAPDRAEVVAAQNTQVLQGARERSNTDAVSELVDLIVVQRQYEAAQRVLQNESELRQRLTDASS
jgi:flagellar basal body rod protein FlgG